MNENFLDVFSIDPGTILFTLINTLIIMFLYKRFLHEKVNAMLEARQKMVSDAIESEVSAAKISRENAEKAEAEYTEKLAGAGEETRRILSRAQNKEREIIDEANKAAALIREKAEEAIELERKRVMNEIKNQVSELVIMTASAVAEKEIKEADNKALIDSFLVNV